MLDVKLEKIPLDDAYALFRLQGSISGERGRLYSHAPVIVVDNRGLFHFGELENVLVATEIIDGKFQCGMDLVVNVVGVGKQGKLLNEDISELYLVN